MHDRLDVLSAEELQTIEQQQLRMLQQQTIIRADEKLIAEQYVILQSQSKRSKPKPHVSDKQEDKQELDPEDQKIDNSILPWVQLHLLQIQLHIRTDMYVDFLENVSDHNYNIMHENT